ncbi:DUF1003 domain-containing protein [Flavobacterium kingsejongi]|uniref:Cyclic nucleotide-binding protein n=1 Tax=Flavobacterium kingsejongi TaxID=1678728 RepID=A0A2S1LSD2_9FLAO|nr:DUF1003 domain-containing protein [Flavobacterium kingsejongi]AWG26571.1 hypothetical protein FK004_15735 [Flavobacterium kingsejongi]
MKNKKTFISDITGKEYPESQKISAAVIRNPILTLIQKDFPDFNNTMSISMTEMNLYREKYISDYLSKEVSELTSLESTVLDSLHSDESLVSKVEDEPGDFTFGQRIADKVATFGGSWTFIISFSVFILFWICANIIALADKGFDPYPFILLNLILSCLAALQAPVIMMSQNRQEEKDRDRAKKDYMINLKSELEIRMLHEKLDHLILHQQQELIEIQRVQIEMMNDILTSVKTKTH